jgi:hypothetical protein
MPPNGMHAQNRKFSKVLPISQHAHLSHTATMLKVFTASVLPFAPCPWRNTFPSSLPQHDMDTQMYCTHGYQTHPSEHRVSASYSLPGRHLEVYAAVNRRRDEGAIQVHEICRRPGAHLAGVQLNIHLADENSNRHPQLHLQVAKSGPGRSCFQRHEVSRVNDFPAVLRALQVLQCARAAAPPAAELRG